jgi:hypothetical protein
MAKNIKKTIRTAGKNISNTEMAKIVKSAGGSTSKALDKISSVQQSNKRLTRQPLQLDLKLLTNWSSKVNLLQGVFINLVVARWLMQYGIW